MNSMNPQTSNRLNRAVLKALRRAVCIYWEQEKARPIPDHLAQLAAKVDEALAKRMDVRDPSAPSLHDNSGQDRPT
jgi:hypothetical protein